MRSRDLGRLAVLLALGALAAPTSAAADTGLGAFWQLDETSGSMAKDASLNHNDGTISAAPRIAGRFGRALHFDGVSSAVQVPRSTSLETPSMSVEAWVRAPSSPGNFRHIVSKGASSCQAASYGLFTGPNGGLSFYVSSTTLFTLSPDAGTGVWNGAWHHVVGSYDGAFVRLYVDGVQVGGGTPSGLTVAYGLPDSNDAFLGLYGGPCDTSHNYQGDLDEARVWQRALAPVEVAAGAAMGDPAARQLAADTSGGDTIVYTSDFGAAKKLSISIESASGTQRISAVKISRVSPVPATANCGNPLSQKCDITLSNDGRTATLSVKRVLLLANRVRFTVTLAGGRTFDVDSDM